MRFLRDGFSDWKEATRAFTRHEDTACHKECTLKWLHYSSGVPINAQFSTMKSKEQTNARKCLLKQLSGLKYLVRQGLAIRGHVEMEGNYNQLLSFAAEDDDILRLWLQNKQKWTSHEVQDELIEMMAHTVLRNMLQEIRDRDFYSLIVDETTDVSTLEQVSISIRSVDAEFEIYEDFLGLYETSSTTAETLVKILKDVLLRFQLPIHRCRGQAYDGAANMSGIHSGVAAQILQQESRALNTKCLAHSLNLAVQDTARQISQIDDILSTVQDLNVLVRASAKRLALFQSIQNQLAPEAPGLKPLCATRWTVRHTALTAVHSNLQPILETLQHLADDKRSEMAIKAKARGLIKNISTFEFLFSLKLSIMLFGKTDDLSRTLQHHKLDVGGAMSAGKILQRNLSRLREDEAFETHWKECRSENMLLKFSEPKLPRYHRQPRRYDDGEDPHEFTDVKQYYRNIYIDSIDAVHGEIGRRFDQPALRVYSNIESLLKLAIRGEICEDKLRMTLSHFQDDLDAAKLRRQLIALQDLPKTLTKSTGSQNKSGCDDIGHLIEQLKQLGTHIYLFDEVVKLLKLFRVMPVTSATAERTFSTLRRLKTYLRSVMSQDRLNNLAILHVHKNHTDNINLVDIAEEFIHRKDNRFTTFGSYKN